jgi:hypothetical protein
VKSALPVMVGSLHGASASLILRMG